MGRRQITTAVTMTVLCGVLVAAAVAGWRLLAGGSTAGDPVAEASPSPSCSTRGLEVGERIRSSRVRVSVYNGGSRSGLAGDTMEQLRRRGFRAGEVANAPDDVAVRRVQVWSTTDDDAGARLVARQFGRRVQVRVRDVDLGPGVDVVVGDRFSGLVRAPRSLRVRQPQEVCAPTETPHEESA